MSAQDTLLFIDANKYLDLYRTDNGKKLLAPLSEQAGYIFVTQQVVDEVYRNRISVAADFLENKRKGMKLHGLNVPDHLSGSSDGKNNELLNKMKDVSSKVSSLNSQIDNHTNEIMAQISESKDEVSIALESIFSKAVRATPQELKRARERKEIGNPPGKKNNPLGDEITWEQILSNIKGKRRLWIISRDGDYGTLFGKKLFLNSFLQLELAKISEDLQVHIFEDSVKGLKHFVETTKVDTKTALTSKEFDEVEAEERALPPIHLSSYVTAPEQSAHEIQMALSAWQKPSSETLKALSAWQSQSLEFQSAINEWLKQSPEVLKALSSWQDFAKKYSRDEDG